LKALSETGKAVSPWNFPA